MNNLTIKYSLLIGILFSFFSCTDQKEEIKLQEGSIQFQLNTTSNSRITSDLMPSKVVVSVNDQEDNSIFSSKEIELYQLDGRYLSQPINLPTGAYTLVDYVVLNDNDEVIYATPKQGAELADLVSNPLPIDFAIVKDEFTNVAPEVIEVEEHSSIALGYSTFGYEIVDTFHFYVGVIDHETGEMINSAILIEDIENNIDFESTLSAKVSPIRLREDGSQFDISVSSSSYTNYTSSLSIEELKMYTATSPLLIRLKK